MNKIIILGHENPDVDSIVSGYLLEKIMTIKGYDVEFIIPDKKIEEEVLNVCRRFNLEPTKFMKNYNLNNKYKKYILVDHNERILKGNIICIIDHHPTSKKIDIDNYYNKKISSTACYIARNNEKLLNEYDLKLACLATLVDTASFHSTKSQKEDEIWVNNLCKKYNFNYKELYEIGLCLTPLDNLKSASLNGLKKYNFENIKVESSYIQIDKLNEDKINKILKLLRKYITIKKIDVFVFIIHNMCDFKTSYYLITDNNLELRTYNKYTSRGNTIMPEVENKLKITKSIKTK